MEGFNISDSKGTGESVIVPNNLKQKAQLVAQCMHML